MKLQLDTTAKTVKIESDIKVSLLIKTLKALLPNDWKDFTLKVNTTIVGWTNPIIFPNYSTPPSHPWYYGTSITLGDGNSTISGNQVAYKSSVSDTCELKAGIFNVEISK